MGEAGSKAQARPQALLQAQAQKQAQKQAQVVVEEVEEGAEVERKVEMSETPEEGGLDAPDATLLLSCYPPGLHDTGRIAHP